MVWCTALDGHGKLSFVVPSLGGSLVIVYCLQGREIQTNCFLASYNNRSHSHL